MQVDPHSDLCIGMISNAKSIVDFPRTGPEQEVKIDVMQAGIRTRSDKMVNSVYVLTASVARKRCDLWEILPREDEQNNRL